MTQSPADAKLALVSELQQTALFKEIPGLGMFRLDPEKKEIILAALRAPSSGALTREGIARIIGLVRALEGIRDQRWNEHADLDAICNTAEQALRSNVGTPLK